MSRKKVKKMEKMMMSLIVMKNEEKRRKKFATMNSSPDQEYENKSGYLCPTIQIFLFITMMK